MSVLERESGSQNISQGEHFRLGKSGTRSRDPVQYRLIGQKHEYEQNLSNLDGDPQNEDGGVNIFSLGAHFRGPRQPVPALRGGFMRILFTGGKER